MDDLVATDRELLAAVQEASTAERLARLQVVESEPEMVDANRQAWEAQKQVLANLRTQHRALREAMMGGATRGCSC